MKLHIGDTVVHWTYGIGQVVGLEERDLSGQTILYYAVKVRDLTVWVPADDNLENRLRLPTPAARFEQLFAILSSSGEPLPEDRHERKTWLVEQLKDGRVESLCRAIRDLSAYRQSKSLNENDQILLKRVQNALLGEWGFALSIPVMQAESDLYRLLQTGTAGD
jgi:CarD family transcriptional regulator